MGLGDSRDEKGWPAPVEREVDMKLAKRIAVALGSLLAVALAGGAHWRW